MKEQSQKIGNETIGYNRYRFLKSLLVDDLTEIEAEEIRLYEEKNNVTPEQIQFKKDYVKKITEETPLIEFKISKKWLWENFLINYKELNQKDFIQTTETLDNVKAIFYYFLKDENFFFCENVNALSKPSFDKGLLLVGSYGNGKTSVMKAIEKTLQGIKGYNFKIYNTKEVVKIFEGITIDSEFTKRDFDAKFNFGVKLFDDLKAEREASNFGKVNLISEILEIRYVNKMKTHGTMNYKQGFEGDIEKAVDEIAEKYGDRVYDRLYEMFNIVEFKGKCELLNNYAVGDNVKVGINIRGNEYKSKYYVSLNGWRIEKLDASQPQPKESFAPATDYKEEEHDDLPF